MSNLAQGLEIRWVHPDGLGAELGLVVGDRLIAIDGQAVEDIIDYRYRMTGEYLEIEVDCSGERLLIELEKDPYEELDIDFCSDVAGDVKSCKNNCVFCFVTQMPRGMRKSLYLKDDDYRLSFIHGNYITLTNLSEHDIERIIDQKLSPLYVSVHTTNPILRGKMLGRRSAVDVLPTLQRLAQAGIEIHTQIVLCPGWNDGDELTNTVNSLTNMHPEISKEPGGVMSVAIVPVGLTAFRENTPHVDPVDLEYSREMIVWFRKTDRLLRRKLPHRMVYLSDEWYYLAGLPVPGKQHYNGFPQLDDGVGTTRYFIDNLAGLKRRLPEKWNNQPVEWVAVTGMMPLGVIESFADVLSGIEGIDCKALGIQNRFFGGTVSIAGLITGQDIAAQVLASGLQGDILIPEVAVRHDGIFLDDMSVDQLADQLGRKVHVLPILPSKAWRRLQSLY
ncbi:MAG: DUF512 domain-containing protein [Armatimonadota bacterium]